MFNYMGCSQDMVEQGVKKFGPAPGAKKMMDHEYIHAETSITSGIYITYANEAKQSECSRLGQYSKCFCGHFLPQHNSLYFGKKFSTACKDCPCKRYKFVPTRPQECGMYWLPRRKDFNVNEWRPPCKCKHHNQQHDVNPPYKCKKCKNCFMFNSNFACISCDGLWEDHDVLYQTVDDRKMNKKTIGKDYLPLATHEHIQKLVFKDPKYKMIEGPKQTQEEKKQAQQRAISMNPKQPNKSELAKIKSPLGFIFKPKYPEFMKK